jgi:hypothetical protein
MGEAHGSFLSPGMDLPTGAPRSQKRDLGHPPEWRRKIVIEQPFCPGSTALPFVILTALSLKCFSTGNPGGSVVKKSTVLPSAIGLSRGVADSRMQFVIFSVGRSAPIEQLLSLGNTALSFVISTGAKRSGEISVWIVFRGNVCRVLA